MTYLYRGLKQVCAQLACLSVIAFCLTGCVNTSGDNSKTPGLLAAKSWVVIDTFETASLTEWELRDTKNETSPRLENPQITVIEREPSGNHYLLKKPAADGIVGNRKALTYRPLPQPVALGETATIYTRINVEYFPNNHVFGLSNLTPEQIDLHDYNALEPSIRITDKLESDGSRNDGTLMVKVGGGYSKIHNNQTQKDAQPLLKDTWYELWYVVNNRPRSAGGQRYDLYVRGGEFTSQQLVFKDADFRMKRELPLIYFFANCNTGPVDKPYGNGGVRYDDLYMSEGILLSTPSTSDL